MTFCHQCGYKLPDEAKFCSNYGIPVKNMEKQLVTPDIQQNKSIFRHSHLKEKISGTTSKIIDKITHSGTPIGINFQKKREENIQIILK